MPESLAGFIPSDELVHPHDPAIVTWNESWFLSAMGGHGEPAMTFRLGVLPNQGRAWLWMWLREADQWLAIEETRLDLGDVDPSSGIAYEKWGLRFGYQPALPLRSGRFWIAGVARVLDGKSSGHLVEIQAEVDVTATTDPFGTAAVEDSTRSEFPRARFEQSVSINGEITVGGRTSPLTAPGHRDRSWGPRTWRYPYVLVDLHGDDRQIYLAAAPDLSAGTGYVRIGPTTRHLQSVTGRIEYDATETNFVVATFHATDANDDWSFEMRPECTPVQYQIAHATEPPTHWPFWRTVVKATSATGAKDLRGWLEASRYPTPQPLRVNDRPLVPPI